MGSLVLLKTALQQFQTCSPHTGPVALVFLSSLPVLAIALQLSHTPPLPLSHFTPGPCLQLSEANFFIFSGPEALKLVTVFSYPHMPRALKSLALLYT